MNTPKWSVCVCQTGRENVPWGELRVSQVGHKRSMDPTPCGDLAQERAEGV